LLARFVHGKDETAFAALVERHGPMVLGVCRRLLSHAQDAEDAFQATFLVLARKAHALAQPDLVGGWLYGVANRIARKARAQDARRRRGEAERETISMPAPDPVLEAAWQEMRALLREELRHLPVKYQAPLVLCYLEGLTNEEAARRLGWPIGSISYRLARGRQLLRDRLDRRRRRACPLALLPMLLGGGSPAVELPAGLAVRTAKAAVSYCWGQATAGLISPAVRKLAVAATAWKMWGPLLLVALLGLGLTAGTLVYTSVTGRVPFSYLFKPAACH
jgi:RNA polymerase sigma factor (sigma-70 family)